MILDKVYKAFLHCEDFIDWAYKPNLPASFLFALEIEFQWELHIHHEGYDTDVTYDLLQPLKKTSHSYAATAVAKTSFDLMGYQKSAIPAFTSNLEDTLNIIHSANINIIKLVFLPI